jgi:hypothetical protein
MFLSVLQVLQILLLLNMGRAMDENAASKATAQKTKNAVPWFRRALVGMEVGPTGAQFGSDPQDVGYAARFDGRDIVRRCVEAQSEYLVIWARDGEYAYYNSRLQPKAPGLKERDVLREAVEEGAKHKLPIIAYCVLQTPTQALRAHPEWHARDKDNKPIPSRVCYNSPYRDYMKQMLSEMLAYGIAGFHLDMVDQGFGPPYSCWCEHCKKQFEAEYGRPMPNGVTWDADWERMMEFRYRTSERFEKDLYAYVRSVQPTATVDFNYHGNPPFSWEVGQRPVQHAGNSDFVTGETGAWGFSALTVGLNAAFYRAATPGLPYQIAMQRGVRMYHDQTTRPLTDIRWELLTLLSHGAFVTMVDKTAFDGWLDPVAYARIGAAFAEVHRKRAHFGHLPVAEVGLWFSSRTRDWFAREKPADYFPAFQGAHKAMVYAHIPWGVALDENATLESLQKFPVLCLPNAAIVRESEVALLRRFVEAGGNLLLTGLSGCYDSMGTLQTRSTLESLMGAKFVRKLDSQDNHLRFASKREGLLTTLAEGIPADWPFLVKGPAVVLQPTTAAAFGELLQPHRTIRQKQGKEGTEWPMSADKPVGPAVLVNRVGKGTVLTIAASPDFATASEHHITEARRLLTGAVRALNPKPRVRISAPATVEAVITDDPKTRTLRIHLLGYHTPPQTTPAQNRPFVLPTPIEEPLMYHVTLDFGMPLRSIRKLNKTTRLRVSGSRAEATIEDVHEVLVVNYL